MQNTKALYAGSFDPPTKGHEYVIRAGREIFGTLVIAIGDNPSKKPLFTIAERKRMLEQMIQSNSWTNVQVTEFHDIYQVDFARRIEADYIIRGIRNTQDFEYEKTIQNINSDIRGCTAKTIYLIPPKDLADVSSSIVKGLVGPADWENAVSLYVSPEVTQKLKEKYYGKSV